MNFPESKFERKLAKRLASRDAADWFPLASHHVAPDIDIEVSWPLLKLNSLVLGRIGKGKTWMVQAKVGLAAVASADKTVHIFDPKGDKALLHYYRREAERAGLPFYVIATAPGVASNVCNLLHEAISKEMPPDELAFAVGYAMATIHPTRVYGAGYFSDLAALLNINYINRRVLSKALTWRNLALKFQTPEILWPKVDPHTIVQLQSICTQLSFLSHPNALPESVIGGDRTLGHPVSEAAWGNRIQIDKIVNGPPCVVYLWAPVGTNPGPSVITMQLYTSLVNNALFREPKTTSRVRHLFVVDEASHWITPSTVKDMEMVRSKGGCFCLAFQSTDQLKFGAFDLTERVLSACNLHVYMSASTRREIEEIMLMGGEETAIKTSHTVPNPEFARYGDLTSYLAEPSPALGIGDNITTRYGTGVSFERVDRFHRNMTLDIASREDMGFIRASVDKAPYYGSGVAKGVYFDYPITAEHFEWLDSLPLPEPTPASPIVQSYDWMDDLFGNGGARTPSSPRPKKPSPFDQAVNQLREM